MEVRRPLLTAEEVAGLMGGRPRTVEQVLRAELAEARWSGGSASRQGRLGRGLKGRSGSTGALRRLIAGALHGAADAICPARAR